MCHEQNRRTISAGLNCTASATEVFHNNYTLGVTVKKSVIFLDMTWFTAWYSLYPYFIIVLFLIVKIPSQQSI